MSFSRSWSLMKQSWSVVKADKELLWMPVLSGIASVVAVLSILGIAVGGAIVTPEGGLDAVMLTMMGLMYLVLAFITLFFNAAVVAAATERLNGGDPTVRSALAAAWAVKGRLFLWSIVVATVNLILQAIRERGGILAHIMAGIAGIAWNFATYFMVPTLLFEKHSIGTSLKESGGLFKRTWGETVVGEGGLALASIVFTFIAVCLGGFAMLVLGSLGIAGVLVGLAVMVLGIMAVAVVFSVLQGVYKAALYNYATGGDGGEHFQTDVLAGTFH